MPPSGTTGGNWPSDAIGNDAEWNLQLYFWKRRMTSDFATIVWRMKLLGVNAVRLPFTFTALMDDLENYSNFYACAVSWGQLGGMMVGRRGAHVQLCNCV